MTVKNKSDITKGSHIFTVSDGLITQNVIRNESGTPIRKFEYTYSSRKEMTEEEHGDDWESHCDPSLLEYYKNMKKRKEEDPVPPETDGNYTPPPGIELD